MAQYVAATSDIPRSYVKKLWMIGLFGTLGFQYFAVKKLKAGFIRLCIGALLWVGFFVMLLDPDIRNSGADGARAAPFIILAVQMIPALYDLFVLWLGKFTDNVGAFLRE